MIKVSLFGLNGISVTPWLGRTLSKKQLKRAIKMATKKAVQNPEISKPFTSLATNIIIKALMARAKNPKLMIESGNVKIQSMGRMEALTKPNTKADTKSAPMVLNDNPLKTNEATHKDRLIINQ